MNSVPSRPAVNDPYTVHVDYSDGTSDDLPLPVTAVLNNFATRDISDRQYRS